MKIKQNYLKVGLVLTALTLLPLTYPAMAGDEVPYKGKEVGAITTVSFHFPFDVKSQTAEGEATHLGHYSVTGSIVINLLSGAVTGTFTLTAANGDMLFLTLTGNAPPPSVKETVDNITVTGGTGRFEAATGSWVLDSHFAFLFGETLSDPYVAILDGTISTPGSNQK